MQSIPKTIDGSNFGLLCSAGQRVLGYWHPLERYRAIGVVAHRSIQVPDVLIGVKNLRYGEVPGDSALARTVDAVTSTIQIHMAVAELDTRQPIAVASPLHSYDAPTRHASWDRPCHGPAVRSGAGSIEVEPGITGGTAACIAAPTTHRGVFSPNPMGWVLSREHGVVLSSSNSPHRRCIAPRSQEAGHHRLQALRLTTILWLFQPLLIPFGGGSRLRSRTTHATG